MFSLLPPIRTKNSFQNVAASIKFLALAMLFVYSGRVDLSEEVITSSFTSPCMSQIFMKEYLLFPGIGAYRVLKHRTGYIIKYWRWIKHMKSCTFFIMVPIIWFSICPAYICHNLSNQGNKI